MKEPNMEDSDTEDLDHSTLPFPVPGPDTTNKHKGLRRSKKKQQADRKEVVGWAVENVPTGKKRKFSKDTSWETFQKTIGFKEGLWMWYEVTGKNGETVVSTEGEFDTMRKLAVSPNTTMAQ